MLCFSDDIFTFIFHFHFFSDIFHATAASHFADFIFFATLPAAAMIFPPLPLARCRHAVFAATIMLSLTFSR
jgi:hypothetical protein